MSISIKIQPQQLVSLQESKITTSSLTIAEAFDREHRNVTQAIQKLDCSADFRSANFSASPYEHPQNGQIYNAYEITKDGFMFLVMGFTGAKAAAWKEAFINAFNQMEAELKGGVSDLVTHSEQQTLRELIARKVHALPYAEHKKAFAQIYERLKNKFRVAKYAQLPRTQLADAIMYISQMDVRGAQSGQARSQPISAQQKQQIEQAMVNVVRYFKSHGPKASANIHKVLRQRYNYKNLAQLTTCKLPLVLADLQEIQGLSHQAWQITSGVEVQLIHWLEHQSTEQVNHLLVTQKTALGLLRA